MSFTTARYFKFNDIESSKYGLIMCNMETGTTSLVSETYSPVLNKTSNSSKFSLLDNPIEDSLTFEFMVTSEDGIVSKALIGEIKKWLLGHYEFKKLEFIEENAELEEEKIVYNCLVTEIETLYFGNVPKALKLTVVCEEGWGYISDTTYIETMPTGQNTLEFSIVNNSDANRPIYPIIEFKTRTPKTNVSIINKTNNNWETKFSELSSQEIIIMDNENEVITSKLDLKRLKNFNKHWFELLQDTNEIKVTGDIEYIKFTYKKPKRVL